MVLAVHDKTVMKTVEQNNRIEDLDINPCSYAHLTFDKDNKNIA
jgi:hypothetical protein